MTLGEMAFLGMVIAALLIFAAALAYASLVASGSARLPKRTSASRNRLGRPARQPVPHDGVAAPG